MKNNDRYWDCLDQAMEASDGGRTEEALAWLDEALRAYTAGNARAAYAEARRGVIRPGAWADLVLLDRDLFAIPDSTINEARVRATIAGGKVVFRR